MLRIVLCLTALVPAASLHIKGEAQAPKYAYVTMFLNKKSLPSLKQATDTNFPLTESQLQRSFKEQSIMNEDDSRAEVRDRWAAQQKAAGLPDTLPPLSIYNEVTKLMDLKQQNVSETTDPRQDTPVNTVFDLAKNLRKVGSQYPLVVMTNHADLLDAKKMLLHSNIIVREWKQENDFLSRSCKMELFNTHHYQKLRIFDFTEYDKMIWMDTDLEIRHNVDELFELDTMDGKVVYGQVDDFWACKNLQQPAVQDTTAYGWCSGLMLFQPKHQTLLDLMETQKGMPQCWGDQSIIQAYFGTYKKSLKGKDGRMMRLFPKQVVSFPACAPATARVIHQADR